MEQSNRSGRLARVRALAEETFGDSDKTDRWLQRELTVLDGRRPIDLIRTQAGTRIVENLLASIAWVPPSDVVLDPQRCREAVAFVAAEHRLSLSPNRALPLISIAIDFHVAEAADLTRLVTRRIPKSPFGR